FHGVRERDNLAINLFPELINRYGHSRRVNFSVNLHESHKCHKASASGIIPQNRLNLFVCILYWGMREDVISPKVPVKGTYRRSAEFEKPTSWSFELGGVRNMVITAEKNASTDLVRFDIIQDFITLRFVRAP